MKDDFQQAYLKEIGVTTPISLFVAEKKDIAQAIPAEVQANIKRPVYSEAKTEAPVMVAESEVEPPQIIVDPVVMQEVVKKVYQSPVTGGLEGLKIKAEVCKACELAESRNLVVFGDGNTNADIVFIGEAPSRDEDLVGKSFVGASGELFQRMLASVGLNRDEVYLMHGVKCRPQHNRAPKPAEFSSCESWLSAQLAEVQPKMICLLGRVVAQSMLKTEASLSELRAGRYTYRGIPVLVIDHPSYLLRAQQNKSRAWQDLCRLQNFLSTLH